MPIGHPKARDKKAIKPAPLGKIVVSLASARANTKHSNPAMLIAATAPIPPNVCSICNNPTAQTEAIAVPLPVAINVKVWGRGEVVIDIIALPHNLALESALQHLEW